MNPRWGVWWGPGPWACPCEGCWIHEPWGWESLCHLCSACQVHEPGTWGSEMEIWATWLGFLGLSARNGPRHWKRWSRGLQALIHMEDTGAYCGLPRISGAIAGEGEHNNLDNQPWPNNDNKKTGQMKTLRLTMSADRHWKSFLILALVSTAYQNY